jgi:hypothetical protein
MDEHLPRWTHAVWLLALAALAGCGTAKPPAAFQDRHGFRFVSPPGWDERDREGAIPAAYAHKNAKLPLPPLGSSSEHLLVRYDRVTSGYSAWLRVSVAELPASAPLQASLSNRSPGSGWKREHDVESLEVSGLPAARVVFGGRWLGQDYLNETVAVRKDENVYIITASFPATDAAARDAVRQAVEHATWQ